MTAADPHRLNGFKRVLSLVLSALFAVLGVLGFQQTGDAVQLLLFLGLSLLSIGVVHLLFSLIERILNSLDNEK